PICWCVRRGRPAAGCARWWTSARGCSRGVPRMTGRRGAASGMRGRTARSAAGCWRCCGKRPVRCRSRCWTRCGMTRSSGNGRWTVWWLTVWWTRWRRASTRCLTDREAVPVSCLEAAGEAVRVRPAGKAGAWCVPRLSGCAQVGAYEKEGWPVDHPSFSCIGCVTGRCGTARWKSSVLLSAHLCGLRQCLRLRHTAEGELGVGAFAFRVDDDDLAGLEFAVEDLLRQGVFDLRRARPAQRPGARHRVVAPLGEDLRGVRRDLDTHVAVLEPLVQPGDHQVDDGGDLLLRQLVEHDRVVHPVEELRPEVLLELLVHLGLHAVVRGLGVVRPREAHGLALGDVPGAQVGGHDDDRVLEVDVAALGV